jgi:serine/threonine protein kinase
MGMRDIDVSQSSREFVRSMDELEKEVSIMTQLRHPNIVLLLGVVKENPPAIVVEFCTRGSLFAVLQRSAKPGSPELTWRVRLQMALGAAAGMLYLHGVPVLHRDLKSANLMVASDYRVKVGDFGLSRVQNEIVGSTDGSYSLHSPRWLAPEVLKDGKYSTASDVYSYAIVMWEIQSLKTPFADWNVYQIMSAVDEGERPPVDESFGSVFPHAHSYRALMQRCWDADPLRRPTFEDILTEIGSILQVQHANEVAKKEIAKRVVDGPPLSRSMRKSNSFNERQNGSQQNMREIRRSGSMASATEIKTVDPIRFDLSPAGDDDAVVIETPAGSPEKAVRDGEGKRAESIVVIDAANPNATILRGMRARNSLNGSRSSQHDPITDK